MPGNKLNFDVVRELGMKLPGVVESTAYGAPSLKAGGKLLACSAINKSAEADSIVVRIGVEQRTQLISTEPDTYYLTAHYANHPVVLVRLSQLNRKSLQELMHQAWQFATAKPPKSILRSRVKSATRKKNVNP